MTIPAQTTGPDLASLFSLFPHEGEFEYSLVAADAVPQPYRGLLIHEHHMTVTVEDYHGDLVDVIVLDRKQDQDAYARKILLKLKHAARVVQFGLMRVNLALTSEDVRKEIVAGQTPLGRILFRHNVLRRIQPTAFLRVVPGPAMMKWFGLEQPVPTYGRLGIIYCDGLPAIEVLEIVAPEKAS
jgi:hypothetical protein